MGLEIDVEELKHGLPTGANRDGDAYVGIVEPSAGFTFHYFPNSAFRAKTDRGFATLLQKWGFAEDLWFERFRFEENLRWPDDEKTLLRSFFQSSNVRGVLGRMGVAIIDPDKVEPHTEELSTKATSMNFFNKFEEIGAISSTGHIRGRLDDMYEDIIINSLVRETMLMEESELYDAFSEKDRKEFIFLIFQHLVLGGASNQYEDHVEEYFKATKVLYKDLLSAKRNESGETEVLSKVLSVVSLGDGGSLYTKDHLSNFTYLIIDPMSRSVIVWRFKYKSIW